MIISNRIFLIQVTSASNISARKEKVINNFVSKLKYKPEDINISIYVIGYKKVGNRIKWKYCEFNSNKNNWIDSDWYILSDLMRKINIVE
jgi:hypothetical protein